MFNVILEPISNREVWIDQCEVRDQDNALVDLSAAVIVLTVREPKCKTLMLTANTAGTADSTITIISSGTFQWSFTLAQTRGLCAETYNVGCTIDIGDGTTRQFFVGTISVVDGIMT